MNIISSIIEKERHHKIITRMITTKKLFLYAGAWLAGFTPHALAESPGNAFSVTPDKVELEEGKSLVLTAQAGGAQRLFGPSSEMPKIRWSPWTR